MKSLAYGKYFLLLILGAILLIAAAPPDSFKDDMEALMQEDYQGPQKLVLSDAEWAKRLSPERYRILREKGTERANSGELTELKAEGVYVCAACRLPLFSSHTKYESGTGWPSFYEPIHPKNVELRDDYSWFFIHRVEVLCARCEGHLGHVFEDGPPPTGQRWCMNSLALDFVPADASNN